MTFQAHARCMVPRGLRRWFVAHFIADILVAVPLMIAPTHVLAWFGWTTVDPVATRLVAAALFGIGIESYLGRNATADVFRGMLNLKIIWSSTAVAGSLWSVIEGAPVATWGVFAIFAGFLGVWLRYRVALGAPATAN